MRRRSAECISPQPNGSSAPVGIPGLSEIRVVQMAMVLVLGRFLAEPANRSNMLTSADRKRQRSIRAGSQPAETWSYAGRPDADLAAYFDSSPRLVDYRWRAGSGRSARAASDQMWLECRRGDATSRCGRSHDPSSHEKRVIPQGSPLSPLLANRTMRLSCWVVHA